MPFKVPQQSVDGRSNDARVSPGPQEARERGVATASSTSAGSVVWYSAAELISRLVGFVMLPIYTRKLSPEDYGVLALIALVLEVASYLGLARVGAGVFRMYHDAPNDDDRRRLVATAANIVNTSHFLGAVLLYAAAPQLASFFLRGPEDASLLRLGALQFLVLGWTVIPAAVDRLRNRARRFVFRSLGLLALQATLNICLVVVLDLGVRGFLISNIVGPLVVGVISLVVSTREDGIRGSATYLRKLTAFAGPLIVASAAIMLTTLATQLALKSFASVSALGLYSLAVTFGMLVVRIGNAPYMLNWEAVRFQYAKHEDRDRIFSHSLQRLSAGLLAVGTGICVLIHDYLRFGATPEYSSVALMVPIAVAAYTVQSWAVFLDSGTLIANKTSAIARANWIAALVTAGALVLFVPRIGAFGAAFALLANSGVRMALVYASSQRLAPIQYRWAPVLRLLLLSSVVILLAGITSKLSAPLAFAAHLGLLIVYFAMHQPLSVLPPEDFAWIKARATTWRTSLKAS